MQQKGVKFTESSKLGPGITNPEKLMSIGMDIDFKETNQVVLVTSRAN